MLIIVLADINKSLNQFQQWLCRKNPQTNSQQSPRKSNWAPNLVLRIAPHNASKTIPSGIPHTSLGHKGYRVPLPFPYFFKYKSGRLDLYCHRGWCIHGDIIDRARLTHIDQDARVSHNPLTTKEDREGRVIQLARVRELLGAINTMSLSNELYVFRGVLQRNIGT